MSEMPDSATMFAHLAQRRADHELTDDELRTEVGKAFESIRWIRAYLDDDSPEARAFDEVHHYAQGTDALASSDPGDAAGQGVEA